MPAVDNEKLNLDNGAKRVGGRLKTVQDGREKFALSVESHEREKVQLKLLEDIAYQLREIQQLTVSEGMELAIVFLFCFIHCLFYPETCSKSYILLFPYNSLSLLACFSVVLSV